MEKILYITCEERVNPRFYHSIGCSTPAPEQLFYAKDRLVVRHRGLMIKKVTDLNEKYSVWEGNLYLVERLEDLLKGEKFSERGGTIIEKKNTGEIEEEIINRFIATYKDPIKKSNDLYEKIKELKEKSQKLESQARKIEHEELRLTLEKIKLASLEI